MQFVLPWLHHFLFVPAAAGVTGRRAAGLTACGKRTGPAVHGTRNPGAVTCGACLRSGHLPA